MIRDISIAVVMTVFNRKNHTENCIKSLLKECNNNLRMDFYITDDNSTDGTKNLLHSFQQKYKNNNFIILQGTGNLYWNKGMQLSYGKALENTYDYYLWVNNDVEFKENFLEDLLKDYELTKLYKKPAIVCGSVKYREKEELSYGGAVNHSKINPYKRSLVSPNGSIQKCDCINGNCLLIPHESAILLGNLDERFEHGFGDFDYGYRLGKYGGQCYVASKFVGICNRNSTKGTWKDTTLSISKRFRLKNNPTGQPPYSHKIFLKKWFPQMWFYYWIKPYLGIITSSIIYSIRKN